MVASLQKVASDKGREVLVTILFIVHVVIGYYYLAYRDIFLNKV